MNGGFSPLPQELVEEIIDWLHNDLTSLASLSRVARRFRHRAQKHIFREIMFSPTKRSPSAFVPLLRTAPHLMPYVNRLILAGKMPSARGEGGLHVHEDVAFKRVYDALCNVEDVELMNMVRLDACAALLQVLASSRISKLTLNTVFLESPHSLAVIMSHFPGAQSLRLSAVDTMSSSDLATNVKEPFAKLTELTMRAGMVTSALGRWMFDSDSSPTTGVSAVRRLNVETFFVHELPIISSIIERSPDFESLTVRSPMGSIAHPAIQRRVAGDMPVFALQKMKSLRVCVSRHDSAWLEWWVDNIVKVQTEASSSSSMKLELQSFEMELDCHPSRKPTTHVPVTADWADRLGVVWKRLDKVLACTSSDTVKVIVSVVGTRDIVGLLQPESESAILELEELVYTSCPSLVERGLLVVERR